LLATDRVSPEIFEIKFLNEAFNALPKIAYNDLFLLHPNLHRQFNGKLRTRFCWPDSGELFDKMPDFTGHGKRSLSMGQALAGEQFILWKNRIG